MSEQNNIRLTPKQATAFTMTRRCLTGPAEHPLDVVSHLTAIQAQYSTTVPLALWTRTASLSLDWANWSSSPRMVEATFGPLRARCRLVLVLEE